MATTTTIANKDTLFFSLCVFYFLYIEPIAALSGVYACMFEPLRFIAATISPSHKVLGPVEKAVTAQLGASYGLFAVMGALILRNNRDRDLWRHVAIGCALSDVGHIYGATVVQGVDHALSCWLWTPEDWLNFGSLYVGLTLRLVFLLVS